MLATRQTLRTFINILIILLLVISCNSNKEKLNLSEFQNYKRISDNRTWGFVNQDGDTVIPLNKYKFLNPIDEKGMILGENNGKRGYINITQDTLIPFIYDDLSVFSHGLAPAKQNGKFGYIDRNGSVVISFKYENESHFYKCKLASAKLNGKFGFIDQNGNEIVPIKYEKVKSNKIDSLVCAMQNGKWAFFSCSGQQLTDFKFDKITESYYDDRNYTYFKKGLCRVEVNGEIGYINENFSEVVPIGIYKVAEPFRNNLAIVGKNGKYGIIDTLGKIIVPLKYDFIEHPSEYSNKSDLFIIKKDGNFQLLDSKASPITDFDIKEFEWDSYKGKKSYQRYFVLTNSNGMSGTVSEKGTKEIPFDYQKIESFDGRSVTYAKQGGKFGLIDYSGNLKYPFEFDEVISGSYSDYFIANKSGNYGMIDENGEQIISFTYESITPTFYGENKSFIVKHNGLFGIIDSKEEIIIPIKYEEISNWVEYGPKEHFVTKNGKKGLISRTGEIVIPPIYDEILVDNSKLIKVEKNGFFGTINWKNEIIHPIEYEQILWEWPYLTNKELDTVYLKKNKKYISTDTNGKILEQNVSKKLIDEKFGYILNYR